MIRPATVAALAALVAVVSIGACTANVQPDEPAPILRNPAAYAEHHASAGSTFENYTATTTEPAEPDPVKITSAVNAPPPKRTPPPGYVDPNGSAAGPVAPPTGSAATALYMKRVATIAGEPIPAVDALALANTVCSDLLPNNGGDLDAAADALEARAGASNGAALALVQAAAAYRCPQYR